MLVCLSAVANSPEGPLGSVTSRSCCKDMSCKDASLHSRHNEGTCLTRTEVVLTCASCSSVKVTRF